MVVPGWAADAEGTHKCNRETSLGVPAQWYLLLPASGPAYMGVTPEMLASLVGIQFWGNPLTPLSQQLLFIVQSLLEVTPFGMQGRTLTLSHPQFSLVAMQDSQAGGRVLFPLPWSVDSAVTVTRICLESAVGTSAGHAFSSVSLRSRAGDTPMLGHGVATDLSTGLAGVTLHQ